jgi:small subunit ribosomal protein S3
MIEKDFVTEGLKRTRIDEYLENELERAGYGGMEIQVTPLGTMVVVYAERPGMVIGRGGKTVRNITQNLKNNYDLENPQVEVKEVDVPELNPKIMAHKIAAMLQRGMHFRRVAYTALRRIMGAGAQGVEVTISGKIRGSRSACAKFIDGYIKKCGEPSTRFVRTGFATVQLKPGVLGIYVRIMPPGTILPDKVDIIQPTIEETPIDTVMEEVVEEPTETAVEEPKEESIADQVEDEITEPTEDQEDIEKIEKEAIEEPVKEQTAETVKKPAKKSTKKPAEKEAGTVKKSAEEPVKEETAEEPTEVSTEESTEEPAEEPTEEIAEKPAEKPAKKADEKPAKKPAKKAAEKPAKKPAKKAAEKPAKKPAKKAAEKPAKEQKEPESDEGKEKAEKEKPKKTFKTAEMVKPANDKKS